MMNGLQKRKDGIFMKKTRRFLSILFASAMILSSMLCTASAVGTCRTFPVRR